MSTFPADMAEFWKEQESQLIRNRDILRILKAKGRVQMPQTLCHICGSKDFTDEASYNDHTMMERSLHCESCGYSYDFNTGNYEETIGKWSAGWTYTETGPENLARRAAQQVATLIRRHELQWNFGGMAPFVQALAANPHDHTPALVLADWIEEHPDQIDPRSGYQNYPTILRNYTDSSGFPPKCQQCGDAGEYYTHSSDCEERHCALAGGPNDCSGAIVRCECQPCLECGGSGEILCECGCSLTYSCDCQHAKPTRNS